MRKTRRYVGCAGATLNLQNDCGDQITVYTEQGAQQTPTTYTLAAGASQAVDVGASWPAGVVWAGNSNKALVRALARGHLHLTLPLGFSC